MLYFCCGFADHVGSDVLRRRFQINTMPGMGYKYSGISGALKQIIVQEGFLGLYKGLVPNILKVAPSMATSWFCFETTRDFFVSLGKCDDDDDAA